MPDDTTRALPGTTDQRQLLRLALQEQRLRIAEQLPPPTFDADRRLRDLDRLG